MWICHCQGIKGKMDKIVITVLALPSDMTDNRDLYDAMDVKCKELGLNKKDWWIVQEHYYGGEYQNSGCFIDVECVNEKPHYKDDAEIKHVGPLDPRRHSLEHWGKPFWMD